MTQYGDLRRLGYFDGNKTDEERAKILADYESRSTDTPAKTTSRTTSKRTSTRSTRKR